MVLGKDECQISNTSALGDRVAGAARVKPMPAAVGAVVLWGCGAALSPPLLQTRVKTHWVSHHTPALP